MTSGLSRFVDSCPGALGPADPGLVGRNVWNTSRVYLPRPSIDRFFLLQLSLESIDTLIAASPHSIADRDMVHTHTYFISVLIAVTVSSHVNLRSFTVICDIGWKRGVGPTH